MNLEVKLYPELLRKMAAGERLPGDTEETEKMAATAMVVEAIEKNAAPIVEPEKKAADKKASFDEIIRLAAQQKKASNEKTEKSPAADAPTTPAVSVKTVEGGEEKPNVKSANARALIQKVLKNFE